MLLKVVGERLAYGLLYGTCHLGIAELGLGLSLKLRLCHLDGDDGGEALAEVLAGNLYLGLLQCLGVFGILLEGAGQRGAETCKVGTALYGVDVVDVGMYVLRVGGVVHDGYLNGHTLLLGVEVDDVVEEVLA